MISLLVAGLPPVVEGRLPPSYAAAAGFFDASARAGLVDELVVKLNPVLFGTGIPLLGAGIHGTQLVPTGSRLFPSGHAVLHYAVPR